MTCICRKGAWNPECPRHGKALRERGRTDQGGSIVPAPQSSTTPVASLAERQPLTPSEFRYAEQLLAWSRGL